VCVCLSWFPPQALNILPVSSRFTLKGSGYASSL
jgi:hypothetical protein